MSHTSYVVVFPTVFAKGKILQLIRNIKQVLGVEKQQFRTVRRDGDVIVIDANDPVFASSALGLLFGIQKIAIARRVENDFKSIVSEISTVGGNLLLKGERFLVKVDGASKGFLAKDVELAATSEIIEKKSDMGAKPGTEQNHDKLLYTHMTRKSAYVCIFSDDGAGGIPFNTGMHDSISCIYDELSAVSCYETIRQGYNPKIIVCYRQKSELVNLAKAVNQILPRLLKEDVTVEVFHIKTTTRKNHLQLASLALEIVISRAKSCRISHVSIPVSTLMFPTEFIDYMLGRVSGSRKIPLLPLSGLDSGIFDDAIKLGMERRIDKLARVFLKGRDGTTSTMSGLDYALKSKQDVIIRVGPNNVHDFLDSLGD